MRIHDAPDLPERLSELKDATVYDYGYLPMVAAYCRRLGLTEVVDTAVQSQMQVQPGLDVQAMVLDVLSGRNAAIPSGVVPGTAGHRAASWGSGGRTRVQ